ncbi:hypothetical protein FACS1894189_4360 [Planctomycetales bacterium]|nr:hypothetical protein FACS1894189_4360 [Planctomycetales bacterium]
MDMAGHPIRFEEPVPPLEDVAEPIIQNPDSADDLSSQFRLISPKDHSRIVGPEVIVLCKWTPPAGSRRSLPIINFDLWVDEMLVPWGVQYGSDTWFVRLKLGAGKHHLRTVAFEADIFVEPSDILSEMRGPAEWILLAPHPDVNSVNRCGDCHEIIAKTDDLLIQGRARTVGLWKGQNSCFTCHQMTDFERQHRDVTQPMNDCRNCHTLH